MQAYEYRVVPAPQRAERSKGVKGTEALFAHTIEALLNELGREGWEYLRAETLPVEERQGLTGRKTSFHNVLVFRRGLVSEKPRSAPVALPALDPNHLAEPAAAAVASEHPDSARKDVSPAAPGPQPPRLRPLGGADRDSSPASAAPAPSVFGHGEKGSLPSPREIGATMGGPGPGPGTGRGQKGRTD